MHRLRRVCVVTGSRADYGLLREVLDALIDTASVQLQLVVTGSHLSTSHGLTVAMIEQDGYCIDARVDMLLASDSSVAITQSMGLGLIAFAGTLARLEPDVVVVLGDRFEILTAATTAMIARIPLAHINGGEVTEGAIDEAMRHSMTKMASYHFTASEAYRRRVIQLGEPPARVFNVGVLGMDTIKALPVMSRHALEQSLNFSFGPRNLLVTFHPVTLDEQTSVAQLQALLDVLASMSDTHVIFTEANADAEGVALNALLHRYAEAHPNRAIVFSSMGQQRYLSAMRQVDAVVGNSSSGLVEAPALGIPTINIGSRQAGRLRPMSVIDCPADRTAIQAALEQVYSDSAAGSNGALPPSPLGNGGAAARIAEHLASLPLSGVVKKSFYDIPEWTCPA